MLEMVYLVLTHVRRNKYLFEYKRHIVQMKCLMSIVYILIIETAIMLWTLFLQQNLKTMHIVNIFRVCKHGGGQTRKRETKKKKVERKHHPKDWSHIRGRQASRSRPEKIRVVPWAFLVAAPACRLK